MEIITNILLFCCCWFIFHAKSHMQNNRSKSECVCVCGWVKLEIQDALPCPVLLLCMFGGQQAAAGCRAGLLPTCEIEWIDKYLVWCRNLSMYGYVFDEWCINLDYIQELSVIVVWLTFSFIQLDFFFISFFLAIFLSFLLHLHCGGEVKWLR